MKKTITLFSYLFHPIFIPLFGTILFFLIDGTYYGLYQKLLILLQVILITIFIPISFFYLLKTIGKIDTIMVSDLSQRKIPLIIHVFLIFILIEKSITINRVPELYFFFFGGIISAIIAFIFLFLRIKASIHLIGISSLTAFAIGLSIHNQVNILNLIAFLILMNGLIAASRLEMKAHNNKELALGFCIGLLPQIALWFLWL